MRQVYYGLVALCAIQIPLALYGFLSFFKSIPRLGDDGVSLDLRIVAHLVWPVACLMGPLLARFPAREGSLFWMSVVGLLPALYGALLTLSGL